MESPESKRMSGRRGDVSKPITTPRAPLTSPRPRSLFRVSMTWMRFPGLESSHLKRLLAALELRS